MCHDDTYVHIQRVSAALRIYSMVSGERVILNSSVKSSIRQNCVAYEALLSMSMIPICHCHVHIKTQPLLRTEENHTLNT